MNYYNEIKNELINNEINRKVKEYAINRSDIETYCKVGKLLLEAGNKYGEGIIRDYSVRLTNDIGKKYSVRYLFDIRKLYIFIKVHPVGSLLTISHYRLLFKLHDNNEINGIEVMLDSDLAELYHVETKRINEAVYRNKLKFPDIITWILDENEFRNLRSQIATSSLTNNYGGRIYNPRVFTEQGVYML